LVITLVAAALAGLGAAAASSASGRARTAIWMLVGTFVALTPFVFIAGSYDCSDNCSGPNTVVPWLWVVAGVCLIVVALTTLIWRLARRSGSRGSRAP
jgi:hypothetical protein